MCSALEYLQEAFDLPSATVHIIFSAFGMQETKRGEKKGLMY